MRAALLCLLLSGCATAPRVEVQRVDVPVPVPCVQASAVPAAPADKFAQTAATDPVDQQVRALLIDRERARSYSARLRALLEACVTTEATSSADRIESPAKP